MRTLKADVVIIGGGVAGTSAALHADSLGLDALIVSKGLVGKSGASIFGGNLVLGGTMLDGNEENVRASLNWSVRYFNHFLVDQDYNKAMGEWSESVFWKELDKAGLYLRRDERGDIVVSKSPTRIMCAKQQGQSSVLLMDMRRKQVFQRGIRVLEEAMATSLLTDSDGGVIGLTALDYLNGELYAVTAKAVVLATGHSDRFAARSTATREQSADGIAMAWAIGAELQNLEIQWWHASDVANPPSWQRLHIYPNPLVGTTETARMYNSRGELFFEQKKDAPYALAPYVGQTKALIQQVHDGNARYDGGYYTSYDHIDGDTMRSFNNHAKVWDALGLDVTKDKMETAASWHFRQGGIHVLPQTMETTVPGLFVAGAVGGHYNGGIHVGSYDGKVVAETVSERIRNLDTPSLPDKAVDAEEARVLGFLRPVEPDGFVPAQIKKRLRTVMGEKMGLVKSERTMTAALDEIADIRERMMPRMGLRNNVSRRFNYPWVEALDVHNLLAVAELAIRSSLLRTESRGPFYREDYPFTDNVNWLKKNIIWLGDGGVQHRTEPYATPYLQPEYKRSGYFEINW